MVGLARVRWVRVEVGEGGPTCHVYGTTGRRAAVRRVPLRVATALIAQGVPSVVRHPPVHRRVPAET